MVYTYKQLRDMVLRLISEENETVTENVVKDLMNLAHAERVSQHPWSFTVWPKVETITLSGGQRQYALHHEMGQPIEFYNTTLGQPLVELPYRAGEDTLLDPTATDSGEANRFRIAGVWPVKQQPTSATTLRVVSTSASDIAVSISIRGETSDGDITTETLLLTGVVAVTGSVQFTHILGVTKSADTVGSVTLSTSGGTTLLKLYPGEWGRHYKVLELLRLPTATDSIRYRFRVKVQPLTNDYDIPQLPDNHALILVYDTLLALTGFVKDIGPEAVGEWKEKQMRLERNLYLEFGGDQQTQNAQGSYIRYTGD